MGNSNKSIFDQVIVLAEERCADLQDPLNLLSGRYSFLVVTTETGQKVKYEFTASGYCEVDYEYLDWTPSESFRKGYPNELTVRDATQIFDKNSTKRNLFKTKPQHVVRDAMNELCNQEVSHTRDDYLKIVRELGTKSIRQSFLKTDNASENSGVKITEDEFYKYIQNHEVDFKLFKNF
jgi:hypothetical protein